MGCGGSKFTEDEGMFFNKQFTREPMNLCDDLINEQGMTKVIMKKAMCDFQEDYVIKTAGGEDYIKCVAQPGKKKLFTAKGDFIGVLVFNVHYSEVNAVDAAFNLPHIYVYTTRPFKEGQEPSDIKEENKALYMWARVHKTSNVGIPKFEIALAEFQGSPKGANLEKFGYMAYSSILFKDGRMEIKKEGIKGASRVDFAEGEYAVTIAACIDPALMLCTIMSMESLKDR